MKILILTYGSRGDVQPYVALGKGLQASGHKVTLATAEHFRDFVEGHGLGFGSMNDDMLRMLDTDQGKDFLENTTSLFPILKRTPGMLKQIGPMQKAMLQESWDVAQEVKPDLVVFHPLAYAGPSIAEKLGVPVLLALLIPSFVPTAERPSIGFPNLKLGGWYNRQTYQAVNRLMGFLVKPCVNELRAVCGLPKQRKFSLLHRVDGTPIPVLHAHSPSVIPQPADWPDHIVTTGYLFLDDQEDWMPPQELVDFLQAGEPPVYIGFGSMAGNNPERSARIIVEALQQAGLRGIIATGWGGLKAKSLPDSILQIDQAPHDWLFPQVSAVVHHGGAGTTAAGLRAGKPSVLVPFFCDQPFWGKRVHELGVGSKAILQKNLTTDLLANALQEVTSDQEIIAKAKAIGEQIRAEAGVGNAVRLIEQLAE